MKLRQEISYAQWFETSLGNKLGVTLSQRKKKMTMGNKHGETLSQTKKMTKYENEIFKMKFLCSK